MVAHEWVGQAFYSLSSEQAARVARLEEPVTAGTLMTDHLLVGCAECGLTWTADRADGECAGHDVGRNDPCPCGSGRKYKRCHGGAR